MEATRVRNIRIVLAVLLVCISAFSSYKYLAGLKEKYTLLRSLHQAKSQISALDEAIEKEKELEKALAQENLSLKDELSKLSNLETDLKASEQTIEQLTSEIALAKAENAALREEKDSLTQGLAQVSQERDDLKVRLSSIPELKKAIKEAKMQISKAKAMMKEIVKNRRTVEGNHGFLVKNGESTYPVAKIKIEVIPASSSK